ncbi:hypothetical protein Hanom_Chr16g01515341 [Helianthus anomalus]
MRLSFFFRLRMRLLRTVRDGLVSETSQSAVDDAIVCLELEERRRRLGFAPP